MSAQSVWARLERDGWAEVERWLVDREPEGLHLDFKEKGRASPMIDEHDLGRMAKAMSAFANVEGGVLVLGVTAEGATKKEPDRVTAVPGISEAEKALSVVERRIGGLTDPPIAGAQVVAIREPKGAERVVLAIVVPKGDGGPHRVSVGKEAERYFMRIASNSLPIPHSVLADMFARQPPPKLRLAVQRHRDSGVIRLLVCNKGRGLAEDVLLRVTIDAKQTAAPLTIDAVGAFWRRWEVQLGPAHFEHTLQRDTVVLHANDVALALAFNDVPYQGLDLIIRARLDARGMQPIEIDTRVALFGDERVIELETSAG